MWKEVAEAYFKTSQNSLQKLGSDKNCNHDRLSPSCGYDPGTPDYIADVLKTRQ